MAERSSNGKRGKAPATLDLMGDGPTEPAPSRVVRPLAPTENTEHHAALFGGGDVDENALHPADVPISGYPAPSQIAQIDPITERDDAPEEVSSDPFGEDDPFADTPMARMLADEPVPIATAMRNARAEVFAEPISEETALEPEQKKETPMAPAPAAPVIQTTTTKSAPGLTVNRRYTQPGQNVWETTEWELRTASIVGSDGTVVFEQRGVEIPKNWSQLATNVVVSKYFRGQVGTLEREYSVKQLIGRVSDKILEWGRQGSYFASDADAETFHDELRYILLHQFAAFNSPVWFNLGWAGRRQAVSACYINEVTDTMESILDLYKTEGMLFKDGSGSGLNLSTLRSSKEPLAAGGKSSGPISFMKGLDASAGSIKSGGSTRRAACMRVLDVDHPDIMDFILCKKDAEEKAHALIDAGYSGAFNVVGGAYDTVPFQNANHSVRVTDHFMQAVEAGTEWNTKFRHSDTTATTLKARDLIQAISEATWVCGDPGMQYDTTINDWHTCSNTDRIYASNPCCFVGETMIETAAGQISFQSLHARHEDGDALPLVFSYDCDSRKPALRAIRKVWIAGYTQSLAEVKTKRGLTFLCTPEHRFLTQAGDYVEAKHLEPGTVLCALRCAAKDLPADTNALTASLAEAVDVLASVTLRTLNSPVAVYDMEVEGTHNFAITDAETSGAHSVVVSNSEYMFLNSTACNLSSLNLMKFRDTDGAFDVASFEHAVQMMITAQEIVVGFAAYPTEKIEERSHVYRTLGLGYANLGALLMAEGLPYDSDAGRAYAGAVTAIMTGRAYHQSAVIARDCGGPFAGYQENREPMLRVMQKHREHVEYINKTLIPESLLTAARDAWDDVLSEGQKNGFRNAQATVLAPTGCLVAGSLVITDRGIVRLNRLGDVNGSQWQDVNFKVLTDTGQESATKFYVNGRETTRRVTTHCGYTIQGTAKHRVKVVDPQTGIWAWKRFAQLAPGDIVPLSLGTMIGERQAVALPPLGEEYWTGDYTARAPRAMTPDLAELIGYFMGDGSLHTKGPRLCVANTDLDVAERIQSLVKSLFNLEAHLTPQQGYCEVAVHSVPLTLWWEACGFSKTAPNTAHSGKGYLPFVPDAILATNDPAVYGAFLRGLYEADGTVTGGIPCWCTTHREFSEEVKTLLLALGIPTSTKYDTTGWGNSTLYVLRLRNTSYASRFRENIGFMSARKARQVSQSDGVQTARHDYIYLAPEIIRELVPADHPLANAITLAMKRHGGAITRRAAASLYATTGDARLGQALRFFYDVVTANVDGGEQLTYDLSVPANVTYVAQGFVSHNTIGFLMDCDTTGIEPDIAIVKYKSLVGGGMMKIVNQTVPEALRRLGYTADEGEAIIKFIDEHDTIEGAPGLKAEHLPIFDCAFRPMNGTRSIHHMGHIQMMAAAQPFISGAISKTVNMPNDTTPTEIADAYTQAWKLGIKAVAIYRDGSKRTQPLNTSKETPAGEKAPAALTAPEGAAPQAVRRRLPDERASITHKFSIGGHEGYLTVGLYPDTQQPGEIFIRMAKEGSSISGLMDSFATAISLALQYGVPLSTLVDKFIHSRFEPSGFTGNKDIPMAKSVMDYIFRYLALRFLQREERQNVGLLADQEGYGDASPVSPAPKPLPLFAAMPTHDAKNGSLSNGNGNGHKPASADNAHLADTKTATLMDHEREIYRMQSDAPPCPECGAITIRSGACYKCISCGTSLGCS
jgi:ribonucleoside-diphosphate reductase alpha chain